MISYLEKYIDEIRETASVIYEQGWGEAYAGNMSIRLEEKTPFKTIGRIELTDRFENLSGKTILLTASGSRMRQMTKKDPAEFCSLITIDDKGSGYYQSADFPQKPTSEILAHLMIHNEYEKRKKDTVAVVHCHPESVITLLHLMDFKTKEAVNKMLFSIHTEAQFLIPDGVGVVGVKNPGSNELAMAIHKELKKREIALIEKHGCISVGKDLNDALDKIEFVNTAIRIYLNLLNLR